VPGEYETNEGVATAVSEVSVGFIDLQDTTGFVGYGRGG
jgi:hypothetical protein